MKNIILILSAIFLFASCKKEENKPTPFQSHSINFVNIAKGSLITKEAQNSVNSQTIITNTIDWQTLTNNLNTDNINYTEMNIDFNNFMVVAIFGEIKPHSGCNLTINNALEEENSIKIKYTEYSSNQGYTVLSKPFHIVKIPKTDKTIIFEIE